ncbi:GntR family transcriptional regulator [Variovorax sp. WS11]|uniref:GntR family transcriptional regulator n=1 Tax=Variovorax sp. WS11 TaxID=1105204 RepID=UPI0015E6D20A|nr:FCD domain-containing protein [Variovorax sp. WS11]
MASALAASIRADVIKGVLAPGSKLRIKEMCERYSAGHIPMREALSRLATSGFVVAEDQRGFRVSSVTAAELADITETRCHVECETLRRSIERGGLDWEERVTATHFRLSRLVMYAANGSGVDAEWERAHVALHAALLSASGSKWLETLSDLLRDQTARYRHLSVVPHNRPAGGPASEANRDVAAEHRAIVDAALARDDVRACELLRQHFQATAELVLQQTA